MQIYKCDNILNLIDFVMNSDDKVIVLIQVVFKSIIRNSPMYITYKSTFNDFLLKFCKGTVILCPSRPLLECRRSYNQPNATFYRMFQMLLVHLTHADQLWRPKVGAEKD